MSFFFQLRSAIQGRLDSEAAKKVRKHKNGDDDGDETGDDEGGAAPLDIGHLEVMKSQPTTEYCLTQLHQSHMDSPA